MTKLSLDIESRSELFFGRGPKNVGLDRYARHESTKILMLAYAFDNEPVKLWDCLETVSMPSDLADALNDRTIELHAFNAQFERVMFRDRWNLHTDYGRWHCTMVLGYSQSFIGGLGEIGACVGLPEDMAKDKRGEDLIKLFSQPQKVTKANPFLWRDSFTDPEAWEEFKEYCKRDVVAEREISRRLSRYPSPEREHRLYVLDQKINDRGLPVDRKFLENASWMVKRRQGELTDAMRQLTGLANPNSSPQLTGWLVDRGYPFQDIGKDTVKKVLTEHDEGVYEISDEVQAALKLRQQVARTSVKKFDAVLHRLPPGENVVRYAYQFAGASRTNRWSSRGGIQLHNLVRTPAFLESLPVLYYVTELIRQGDYEGIREFCSWCVKDVDILDALVGCVRSMIAAPDGYEFVVADLASIETVGIGVLAGCERILNVFREGRDAYKDFATVMYRIPYSEVTKAQRTICKPSTLGSGFGLAGGDLREGKKTGLWGYAENMGVVMTREQAHTATDLYRSTYPEVPQTWYAYNDAMAKTIVTGRRTKVGPIEYDYIKPYMRAKLPSGRYIYYHKPQVHYEQRISKKGNEYRATCVTVMGKSEQGNKWVRRPMAGHIAIENNDQAMCRDILGEGMLRADEEGFDIRGTTHDEIIALQPIGGNHTWQRLGECMTKALPWLPDAPLGYDGFSDTVYHK